MEIDPAALAGFLEELRVSNGNLSPAQAAARTPPGTIQERQWRRLENREISNPHSETLVGIATAFNVPMPLFMERITTGDNSLTGRLERLETKVDQILGLWRTEALPALARLEAEAQIAEATRPTGRSSPAKGRRARAS